MSDFIKALLLMSLAAVLLALPELTWTQYPPGIGPDPDVISFESIIDGIFYALGIIITFRAALYFKNHIRHVE